MVRLHNSMIVDVLDIQLSLLVESVMLAVLPAPLNWGQKVSF
ncbi:hypothetical protein [Paenibacillus polymyxa]|nr:hypothetical protein [Paenibacillus polymyxa]